MKYAQILFHGRAAREMTYQDLVRRHPKIFTSKVRTALTSTEPGMYARLDWLLSEFVRICSRRDFRTLEHLTLTVVPRPTPAFEFSFHKKLSPGVEAALLVPVFVFMHSCFLACKRCGESTHRKPSPNKISLCRRCRTSRIQADFEPYRYLPMKRG
jgi:hypothetical protein